MTRRLDWERDGRDWPHRAHSRFLSACGFRWHVQVMGEGPAILLIHGTGASTHSFRGLISLLTPHYTLVVPDLPGHGFTDPPPASSGYTLPAVARGLDAVLKELALRPVLAVGHSAGAAVAIRMALDQAIAPVAVVSLNGALLPFPGIAHELFGPAARFLASSAVTAQAFSFFAGASPSIERMLRSTGSRIDVEGMRYYARLAGSPGHVQGALGLMANWDLHPLVRDLPHLIPRLVLVTGSNDGMVPPSGSYRIRGLLPKAELISLPGLGHLAHEERPSEIADLLKRLVPVEMAS